MSVGCGARALLAQLAGSTYQYLMGSGPGAETVVNGRRCLYFGGTGYYGFQTHPELIAAAHEALDKFGLCSATSRNKFGTTPLYLEVERTAAQFFGAEESIYLASGYLVNIAGFQALSEMDRFDAIFMDEGAHWSITDFARALGKPVFTYAHLDTGGSSGIPENRGAL